jgi:acyl-CoA thioesterase FadM
MSIVDLASPGVPVLHSRVEQWECDYNNHWNVRFYARSFDDALDSLAQRNGIGRLSKQGRTTHIRFHRELFVGAFVEVRAARLVGGDGSNATLLMLSSHGKLSATALDVPLPDNVLLPRLSWEAAALALPRGINSGVIPPGDKPLKEESVIVGPLRPAAFDDAGDLLSEEIYRCGSLASTAFLSRLGFTPEFSAQSRINRMSVESKIVRHSVCRPGDLVTADTKLLAVSGKGFSMRHTIYDGAGNCVAAIEQALVSVNLDTRRAVGNPDFIIAAAPA